MNSLRCFWTIVLLAIPATGFQPSELTVKGFVLDRDSNKPVSQARISSTDAAQEGLSDNEGSFRLPLISGIKPGESIRVRVEKAGYIPLDKYIVASGEPEKFLLVPVKRTGQSTSAGAVDSPPGELGSEGVFKAAVSVLPEVPRPGEIMTVTVLLTNVTDKPIHNALVHIEAYRPDDTRLVPVRPQRKQSLLPHETIQLTERFVDHTPESLRIAVGVFPPDYKTKYDWIQTAGTVLIGTTGQRP